MMKRIAKILLILLVTAQAWAQTAPVPDPVFLTYLKNNFSQTINSSDQLIISEAAKVTATISCSGQGINNIDGIQYFKNITSLYLANNNLSTLPDLSPLTQLKILHLQVNNLTALPSLSTLTKLEIFLCYQNQLQKLPDLSRNTSLQQLIASKNNIDVLPDLSALTKLKKIDVGENQLKALPDLSKLQALEELTCWKNQIVQLPSLSNCPNLSKLNAGDNQLISTPDVSSNVRLKILSLDRNNLTTGPDITHLDSLTQVELHYNYLTFGDLLPYKSYNNFSNAFTISPQKTFPGGPVYAEQGDTLVLSCGLDTNVANTTYEWFSNSGSVGKVSKDSLGFFPMQSKYTGQYTCQVTNSALPGLTLLTDLFIVKMGPCIDMTGVSYEATGTNCFETGTAAVHIANPPAETLTYYLTSPLTGVTVSSATGSFNGLAEPEYILTLQTFSQCRKVYPDKVRIGFEDCRESLITPDNDGEKDRIFFQQKGKAIIYDLAGNVVRNLTLPAEWDGTSDNGKLLSPGYYITNINGGEEVIRVTLFY